MSSIKGSLCISEKELKRAASKKRKDYIEQSVHNDQVEALKEKGWDIVRTGKRKTRMRKAKAHDVLFEDRVWMIFYNLGFTHMNKDRNCKIQFDTYSKNIDVLAKGEENIFIVECRSSASEDPINARRALEEYVGKREDIQKAIEAEWGRGCGRINIVVAISSQGKRDEDEKYIKEKSDKNIFLWSAREIEYIEDLIDRVGSSAKFQLYSVIFANRKQKSLKIAYPSIKGKIGGHTFYTFVISAKQLLKYAYVHHRSLTGIIEASQVYQRMLKNDKLKKIAKFIDIEGGFFPNSIIVNFSKPLQWNKKEKFDDDVAIGILTLPEYFGSAWIIDGQHRLYGAAKAEKEVLVPVLAFENLDPLKQANLFVEINERQTSVEKNLLWDLYSDIYRNAEDVKQKFQFQIAETAKIMEASGPLSGIIEIQSIPKDRPIKLKLTTICDTIEKYSPWDHLKHPTDETKTPDNAGRLINLYYGILKSLWPEDWAKGNKGVLLTNNGFGVFMMVFNDILKHLAYKQKTPLFQASKTKELESLLKDKFLIPLIEYLKTDDEIQNQIRSNTGRGPQNFNAIWLDGEIKKFIPDYSPPRMKELPSPPPDKELSAIPGIEKKARLAEPRLRNFVLERLKRHYGSDKWWKLGITKGPKDNADKEWIAETKRKPHLKHEKNQNERKFEFFGLGELIEIIIYRDNWENIFIDIFEDNPTFQRRIKDIIVLRNPVSHTRKIDDQDVADGISGLLWLSNCINDQDLNPYT